MTRLTTVCYFTSILFVHQPLVVCAFGIHNFLSTKATEILVHTIESSKLDHCNSFFYIMLQKYVTCSRKYYYITLIPNEPEWLPVLKRTEFMILLLTFKAPTVVYKLRKFKI